MSLKRFTVFFSLFATAQVAVGSGKHYLTLVGELFGAVESPRLIRDFCEVASPSTAKANARLYEEWRSRHKDLLDAVAVQVAHADARLKKQSPPADAESFDQMRSNMKNNLEEILRPQTSEEMMAFCKMYPQFLEKKDAEAATSIRELSRPHQDLGR
jgi:hypothetical protein